MTSMKGHESKSYETLLVIDGLLFNFTIVKMRGPNKSFNHLTIYNNPYSSFSKQLQLPKTLT